MRAMALGLASLLVCASAHAQSTPPAVEAFGRLPAIADAAISPDGTRVALLTTAETGATAIAIYDLEQNRRIYAVGGPEEGQLRGVGWADDTHISYVVTRAFAPGEVLPFYMRFRGAPRRVEYMRNGVVDLATERNRLLTTSEDVWADQRADLIAPIEGDPGAGRMIGRAPGVEVSRQTVYRVRFDGGRAMVVAPRGVNADTIDFVIDENGAVAARIDADERSNRWSIHVYDGETPRLLIEDVSATGAPVTVAGLAADGRLVLFDEDEAGEFFALYAVDRATGRREVLFQRQGGEVGGAIRDPWTRRIVGAGWTEQEYRQEFFDADLRRVQEQILALLPGALLSSWSRDKRRVLVYGERGLDGGAYYVYTASDNRISRLSYLYPQVAQSQSGERQAITYRARDNVRIPAYLTLPRAEGRGLPLVVLVHGGPSDRDTMAFDYWASFLASRGYAVLQPNFRGSSGYGASWERAGHGQWGGLMQTDVEDGVAALVRTGAVDPARVCIVGASYGGYAALAGATLTPDRYRCAASIAGVSDLVEMLRQEEAMHGSQSMTADYWRMSIGDRQEDRDRIRSVSPANLAGNVRIPILLMHGTDDSVVPIIQSRRMYDRLRAAGKDVRFVELRGDDHWLSDAPTRIQMLHELETFLAANLSAPGTQ
jgi:dipeptidyl aminopeptidase/acylaminoacyl peptidase